MSQTLHQYFSTRPRISIITKTGKRIHFSGGVYITDKQDEIDFLNAEIAVGHQMIYVKEDQKTITKEQLDPLHAIKQKAKEEALAELRSKGSVGMVTSAGMAASSESNSGSKGK